MEKTNIKKIRECLKKGKLSKTEICNKTGIHWYLIDSYLDALIKNNIIIKETNNSGKYTWYRLK